MTTSASTDGIAYVYCPYIPETLDVGGGIPDSRIRGNDVKTVILDELSDPLQIERMKLSSSVYKTVQLLDMVRKHLPSKLAEDLISVQPIMPDTFVNLLKALEEAENKQCRNETPLLESIIQCRLQPSVSRETAITISTS